ncbi:type I restriction endonuclease subunit R [Estrella lausannensis]|uniref:Type I restriction enzyme endonuclease subunit n=1 Tax=Estrella lausannensis TaxID=483423 RepID=A0A0H5DPZ6_9BACT|nr:HsdR family type I site-specific deoxyribonuclease [Estrella lausannensis]CRX37574.1 HsdR family type I site-specific deoxyribonuclease [Estrella lausannensis]
MKNVGHNEEITQQRVIQLFRNELGYRYLGNWIDEAGNRNIEEELLLKYLQKQGYEDVLIKRAIHLISKAADDKSKSSYDRNKDVYELLRYGVNVRPEVGENTQTIHLIDWNNPENNDFAIAEEVTVKGVDSKSHTKRPDVVIYVNGIALGVIELKRSTVSVSEGIRQNLDNQKSIFIQHFFSTIQLVMAGNDTEGLRYGTIETPEKYYLTWKEESSISNTLDRHISQICNKARFLELIHDYIVFDAGIKKLCRPNQYFGIRAAQEYLKRQEGGIIWHTQGSGKSLTMVWLAKWIRENITDARVLIITDRKELDEQIEKTFKGVNEKIYRTKSGADLLSTLNETTPWLVCSLIHKFGGKDEEENGTDIKKFIEEMKRAIPSNFQAKGNLFVFVDECHRTQSGDLHKAMKAFLPNALFLGFTGTPLLKADKQRSIEIFGPYIHTYKFNEAVEDGVVLDLRYEARDIDQKITSQEKIDLWFTSKTKNLTDLAKAQLKKRWGTLRKVLSSQSRLEKIVADILLDMETRDRLISGRGNAMLVCDSIFSACKFYELFDKTDLGGKCAIVTSYKPSPADIKGEESGEGMTEKLRQYEIYNKMLAGQDPDAFEKAVKKKFVDEPGQMKLLIVVDKLLTGFDAPSATYLYIDKQMHDHGLFQAICRVNRLDGDDKEYGYIIDYKDLFKHLEKSVTDYTAEALAGYDKADVAGLLQDRLSTAKERLEQARESIKSLCEPVEPPKDTPAYMHYFCAKDSGNSEQLKENEPKRLALYKLTAAFIRAFANIANELEEAGYSLAEINLLKSEVDYYEKVRTEVKIASSDYIDLKMFEPAMRHLIDTYIRAEESEKISAFDDLSLIQLIVERGPDAVQSLPKGMQKKEAVAETIENNVRKLIIDEHPINPKYYEKMSELLSALIEQRRQQAIDYETYLAKVIELTKQVQNPANNANYPSSVNTAGQRALYDNLDESEEIALAVHEAVIKNRQDDWRNNRIKRIKVQNAIKGALTKRQGFMVREEPGTYMGESTDPHDALTSKILDIVQNQPEY